MNNQNTLSKHLPPPDDTSPKLRWRISWWLDKHEPIWLGRIRYRISHFYWDHIRCVFINQNRWATRVIPRTWADKDYVISEVLYAAIIHYVEGEKCFETIVIDEPMASKIREIYAWAKEGRKREKERISSLWNPGEINISAGQGAIFSNETGNFESYKNATDAMEKRDDEYLAWIVNHRGFLWT